jgi:hypothetical protein
MMTKNGRGFTTQPRERLGIVKLTVKAVEQGG